MKALLLDYNGVIVNDEPLHLASFRETLADDGIPFDPAEYAAEYLGLARAGIAGVVEAVVCSGDVPTTKPDPAGLRLGLRRLEQRHQAGEWHAVVIEDSLPGIGAARALGAGCVAITTSHRADELGAADVAWTSFDGHSPAELDDLWRRVETS